ncbi:UDP-N-acetyl-D-glucosamine 6-dehydrogenase [[Clostridium] ultunense Esp]|uniref:UDP-N-acetyl-D-glucosamine 6-dehydrogenase n=1 Tax=[Clostridium] ultunense Esp TaxID=1288971 RepID=M1ZFT4_9FIRM|nr:nucleotide sugar dehydrogenase [Schnuerera ultunensis]CCQ97606.1 UDP-N-acetyl-D-glucosamine 6-dehydrogenase [[Clostridium] ultunense Esp]SHD77248.1 UDP-N-acetyl-D-glucosamine 6-dehydrogenase [[Clostridium] ultunense Esp]
MLLSKIKGKRVAIGIIGLGYVGLPLAIEIAKNGYKVLGIDIDIDKINYLNEGISYIDGVTNEDLKYLIKNKLLMVTTDSTILKTVDCIIICVPTPIDEYKVPNTSYIENSIKEISKNFHRNMLVVLESTTYPGTTEELLLPNLKASGLQPGKDFHLAYSAERMDPGNKEYNVKNTTKVVGGVTDNCTKMAAAFYKNTIGCDVYKVSSPKVAEMCKILENTYRNINIALANEMAIICDKIGIDIWEVIDAAETKPYGFQSFYPGPGVGGHCIPVDPLYLMWKAREYDYHTRLIGISDEINSSMPDFVLEKTIKILNRVNKPLKGAKILMVGVAYKQDIDDIRESPALKVLERLEKEGAIVEYYDPFVPQFRWKSKMYKSKDLAIDKIKEKDIVIITTAHTKMEYNKIVENAQIVFDTKNVTKNMENNRENIIKL